MVWCGGGADGSGVGVVVWWRCWWVVVLVLWCDVVAVLVGSGVGVVVWWR